MHNHHDTIIKACPLSTRSTFVINRLFNTVALTHIPDFQPYKWLCTTLHFSYTKQLQNAPWTWSSIKCTSAFYFYAGCGAGGRRTCTCCSPAQLRHAPAAGCAAHACHAQRSYSLQARTARPFSIRVAFLVQPGVWHRSRPVAARHTSAPIDPVKPVVCCRPTCLRLSIPAHLWHAPAAGVRLMPFVPSAFRHRQCVCKRAYRVNLMY